MKLRLEIKGASPAEQQRGISAADAFFVVTGISAQRAADGMFALEGWDDASSWKAASQHRGRGPRSERLDANKAEIAACCADWPADAVPEN
ncbi:MULTISPECIES: hypothetical protein [unclassified Mesorhizobium]|uniref:hypothetical protein n=1 Tax=unclassified Mesorhizobium TaxID=325217 RepID=UPI000F761152|nr:MULTISPECIES: hypothetical protein [unclassified Mesorhizobium]AZO55799.1 hypothetical protein EJ077_22015 [Mesorhizobium sp. M8A.F.Ca.ET.057.01.1.1]RWE40378.1 MAG: hypothetical protein EOS80_30810 [Mesorhizobium sp.]TJX79776.1 MAG: hypothetical protein E5W21_01590 [Mesorhizobium sp.]